MRPEGAPRALVTGGAGFIGSTLVDRLIADGWEVAVVDNLSSGTLSNLEGAAAAGRPRLEVHRADIMDPSITALVEAFAPEVVFHLAAQCDVRTSMRDPAGDASTNIIGTINVLEAVRLARARVVFASSGGTIYGEPPAELLPLNEDAPRQPLSPYGIAKEAAGNYIRAYSRMHGVIGTTLALANVYGPRQPLRGEAGVVAIFAGLLAAGEPCTIYGSGEQTRDFVFVDDVVDAFVRAAERRADGVFNIGTGREVTINELHAQMAALYGVRANVRSAPARPGELDRNCLDHRRALDILGWSPTIPLREGLLAVLRSVETRQRRQ